jgi:hypothetical protein
MLVAMTALTLVYIAIVVIGHLLLALALLTYLRDDHPGGRSRHVEATSGLQPVPAR